MDVYDHEYEALREGLGYFQARWRRQKPTAGIAGQRTPAAVR